MRLTIDHHKQQAWRVHGLVDDFELDEVWAYPIVADPAAGEDFARFVDMLSSTGQPVGIAGLLLRVRFCLGRVFGWDEEDNTHPIPGCVETSLRARLSDEEQRREEGLEADPMGFQLVYQSASERLVELSNSTVHAALHVGWVARPDGMSGAEMAVYWKPRGWVGRLYMALIKPFRVWLVYPSLMRKAASDWAARRSTSVAGANEN